MSFILDALKKSETERQQQSTAEFAAIPSGGRPASVPRWLWLVGSLLAINLAVLAGLLLRPDPEIERATQSPAAVAELPRETSAKPSFVDRVGVAQQNAPQEQPRDVTEERPVTASAAVIPIIISQDPSAIQSTDIYPTFQEVRASGASDIPDLHLDIHVYSEDPRDRFVFINMSKHREGSQLAEGPVVAEITPDGVVLGHMGRSFLLPRE